MTIRPADPGDRAPNGGEWFSVGAEPGRTEVVDAVATNPQPTPARIRVTYADLRFRKDTPDLVEPPRDAGRWLTADRTELTVPAEGQVPLRITVRVPTDAEPGDHIGAVIAENLPSPSTAGGIQVLTRAATRFYVTVPGAVQAKARLERVDATRDRALAPRWATVTVLVRNTGNVRLRTDVRVGGTRADGADLVLSHSREQYVVRKRLPIWGGPVDWPVMVRTRTSEGRGPTVAGTAKVSTFPIVPLLVLLLLLLTGVSGWQLGQRRRQRLDALAAEVRRLQQRLDG